MSLPNYLASIKSSGFYRFVWDKSVIPAPQAATMRLLVGYSEKGPFNTPVYIKDQADFIATYGNISKRLERKGVYFHRMALQALTAGPIFALNLKKFSSDDSNAEFVDYLTFNPEEFTQHFGFAGTDGPKVKHAKVTDLYDTNRFWHLNPDNLGLIKTFATPGSTPTAPKEPKLLTVATTGDKGSSCTLFIRKYKPSSYNITIRDWYINYGNDMPEYMESIADNNLNDYFAEVYVFRGEYNENVCKSFSKYFVEYKAPGTVSEKSKSASSAAPKIYMINPDYTNVYGEKADALAALAEEPTSNFLYKYQGCLFPYFKDANEGYISLDLLFNSDSHTHKMMMKLDERAWENTEKAFSMNAATTFGCTPIYLKGYEYKTITKADSPLDIQNKTLEVLNEKGIREALTNRVDIEYHYIVDTFDSYVDGVSAGCKVQLSQLAKQKDNAFAILNFPAIQKFIDKGAPYLNEVGKFDMKKVAEKFTIAGEPEGASWCAYFTQLNFSDGTVKSTIPSAALVSNRFIEKWGSRQPYYIVAGPNYGVLSFGGLIGPDYNYSRPDLDVLEPMGVNAIVYVPRRGTYINSNQTAKQKPVSALSKINVRELVIYLQNEIEYMMEGYQWELNTQTLRDTIKRKADYILDDIKDNGGIYAYTTICDENNNTPEIIDNEMVVLGVEIEPSRGSGKMIQTLTIHKTGGLTSVNI